MCLNVNFMLMFKPTLVLNIYNKYKKNVKINNIKYLDNNHFNNYNNLKA